jgi:uncharacterized protein (DUF1501 family)
MNTSPLLDSQISRRSALRLIAAGVTVASLGEPIVDSLAALPRKVGAPSGVALVVFLAGGNDQLNTVIPFGQAHYFDRRGPLAIGPNQIVDLGGGWGLNDRLRNVKRMWDAGKVALYQGVGYTESSLSHFNAAAVLMSGRTGGDRSTGWLGRYLDALAPALPMAGVAIADTVPLLLRGRTSQTIALPADLSATIGAPVANGADTSNERLVESVRRFGAGAYSTAAARRIAANTIEAIDTAERLSREYVGLSGGGLERRTGAAARVLSAGFGVKVAYVQHDGYDTHANQLQTHSALLGQLDSAIDAFFANLSLEVRPNAVVVVFSEFGRRPLANASGGTDHGTCGDLWVIGDSVIGGRRGEAPSLDQLDANGNLIVTTSFGKAITEALTPALGPLVAPALKAIAPLRVRIR